MQQALKDHLSEFNPFLEKLELAKDLEATVRKKASVDSIGVPLNCSANFIARACDESRLNGSQRKAESLNPAEFAPHPQRWLSPGRCAKTMEGISRNDSTATVVVPSFSPKSGCCWRLSTDRTRLTIHRDLPRQIFCEYDPSSWQHHGAIFSMTS